MKYLVMSLAVLMPLIARATPDDTLKSWLNQSDLVVIASFTGRIIGIQDRPGVIEYVCDVDIHEVIKGDATLANQEIPVALIRHQRDPNDTHPLIQAGSKCILFLKADNSRKPIYVSSDPWFSIQYPLISLSQNLKRLVNDEEVEQAGPGYPPQGVGSPDP
jgi:hypothetical protein